MQNPNSYRKPFEYVITNNQLETKGNMENLASKVSKDPFFCATYRSVVYYSSFMFGVNLGNPTGRKFNDRCPISNATCVRAEFQSLGPVSSSGICVTFPLGVHNMIAQLSRRGFPPCLTSVPVTSVFILCHRTSLAG